MDRSRKNDFPIPQGGQAGFSVAQGLNGFVGLVIKREALRIARRVLIGRTIEISAFREALNAILTFVNNVKPWRAVVEAAYKRIQTRNLGSARFLLMVIRSDCRDHAAVLELVPKRFTGKFALLEVIYCMEAAFATEDTALLGKLRGRLPRFINEAEDPAVRAQLLLCLTELRSREDNWESRGRADIS